MLAVEIERAADRAEALDSLANKGVHSAVDERDLELTIVHTYLLAGQLLELLPEDVSAELLSENVGNASGEPVPEATAVAEMGEAEASSVHRTTESKARLRKRLPD